MTDSWRLRRGDVALVECVVLAPADESGEILASFVGPRTPYDDKFGVVPIIAVRHVVSRAFSPGDHVYPIEGGAVLKVLAQHEGELWLRDDLRGSTFIAPAKDYVLRRDDLAAIETDGDHQ